MLVRASWPVEIDANFDVENRREDVAAAEWGKPLRSEDSILYCTY